MWCAKWCLASCTLWVTPRPLLGVLDHRLLQACIPLFPLEGWQLHGLVIAQLSWCVELTAAVPCGLQQRWAQVLGATMCPRQEPWLVSTHYTSHMLCAVVLQCVLLTGLALPLQASSVPASEVAGRSAMFWLYGTCILVDVPHPSLACWASQSALAGPMRQLQHPQRHAVVLCASGMTPSERATPPHSPLPQQPVAAAPAQRGQRQQGRSRGQALGIWSAGGLLVNGAVRDAVTS